MKLLPSADLINQAFKEGYAIPSFCVWNAETTDTVLSVASALRAPVMLMNGPGEFCLLSPEKMAATVKAIAATYDVPTCLHLDHGKSLELVDECIAAGYTSVMLDYSDKSFDENAGALRSVVRKAKPLNITVEGEIGAVGQADQATTEGNASSSLTDPDEAAAYARETGVDLLAVSIGNAHGHYAQRPRLDFELLKTLRAATDVPIVLHGGSGTPAEDLQTVISLGIAKINVASDLVSAVRRTLYNKWENETSLWVPLALSEAMEAMAKEVERWIRLSGAAGRA